ncbi:MAG: hypothetical protein AMXMBFR47_18240 [Planctomycetota bacterium]
MNRTFDQDSPRILTRPIARSMKGLALVFALATAAPAADRAWNSDYGGWSEVAKWSPNGLPGEAERVFVGTLPASIDGILHLDMNATIAELEVRGRSQIYTDQWRLTVNGPARIIGSDTQGNSNLYARLLVVNGGNATDFRAASLQLTEGMIVLVDDPAVAIDGNVSVGAQAEFLGGGLATVGGNFTNSGLIEVFDNDMTINVTGWIDLDGTGNGEIVINPANASDLYILADSVSDAFDGRIFIGGGSTLAVVASGGWALGPDSLVQTPWFQSEDHESVIWGSPLTVGGTIRLYGTNNTLAIEAPTTFTATAVVDTNDEGPCLLELNAASTVNGGMFEISPPGTSVQFNHTATINGGDFVLDEDSALGFNGTTTVSGGEFTTFSNFAADGAVLFNGPTTWSGTVNIDGIARQMGNATVSGQTVIHADVFDMDGGGANWTINNGLVINAQAIDELTLTNAFNTQMTIGGSLFARLTVNLTVPGYWQMGGQMTIVGDPTLFPTRVAGDTLYVDGDLSLASGRAHIASDLIVGGTMTIPAGATLRVGGATQIYSWATFVGGGTLRNSPTGNLNLYDGAALDQVGVVNDGVFYASLFPAVASVGAFENGAGGIWSVNVVGPAAGSDHDLLIVSDGPATLAGELRVRHYDLGRPAFRPEVGDEYTILTALDGVSGAFTSIPRSFSQGLGFDWTVEYGTNDVTLRVATIHECPPGDLNDDGDIDISDLASLLANFGTASGATWPDGDLDADGAVTLTDLAILLSNFGSACA